MASVGCMLSSSVWLATMSRNITFARYTGQSVLLFGKRDAKLGAEGVGSHKTCPVSGLININWQGVTSDKGQISVAWDSDKYHFLTATQLGGSHLEGRLFCCLGRQWSICAVDQSDRLQRLPWLYRPIRERQSLSHLLQMNSALGPVEAGPEAEPALCRLRSPLFPLVLSLRWLVLMFSGHQASICYTVGSCSFLAWWVDVAGLHVSLAASF